MSIVGDHPETGVRFVFERPLRGGPPWVYRGDAFTPSARFPLEVSVAADGEVRVSSEDSGGSGGEVAEISEKVRLLFRSLYRQARELPGGEPPRKVVRWRGVK